MKPYSIVALATMFPSVFFAVDFKNATVVLSASPTTPAKKAAQMLVEEVEKRTQLRLKVSSQAPVGAPAIYLRLATGKPESFTLTSTDHEIVVAGADDRGVVFGTGYLLRQFHMSRQRLELDAGLKIATAPKVAVRGQQLGYRPKTNAYDAWSVPMWEQYIRELAIFGNNTIELIPPRSDDAEDSPHFALPKIEMMVEMSRIANEYGLDVSVWYPAMDKDYSDPATVEFALKEWEEVFRRLPRIDAIFVPGGDPGHTQPKYMFALLEKQTASLHRYHPKAQMWLSPQGFTKEWRDEFWGLMAANPPWLSGLVFGPQVYGSLEEFRALTPKRFPIRFYPDITHSTHAEFPVPDWDLAYSTTEAREVINPRPVDETAIFHRYQRFANGFVTYSEGCNDDVNKFIWSGLGWNPDASTKSILTDFSRFFIGDDMADSFADGLFALEQNWRGPLASNRQVEVTLAQFQDMERRATPQQRLNWRFNEALYRAYYDAYIHSRLLSENRQEEMAMAALTKAKRNWPQTSAGSLKAMEEAASILDADARTSAAREYRARVFELAEALFQSIHMQLSVDRYKAISIDRGASLDSIDFALNNRVWLENRFAEIRAMASEDDRIQKISELLNWTNPGPGGFYDALGFVNQRPHLVMGESYAEDPDFLRSPLTSTGVSVQRGWRTSSAADAEIIQDRPLRMRYTDLDPSARYKVRITYGGDARKIAVRLTANGIEVHPFREKGATPEPVEFEIPLQATAAGSLTLEWTRTPGLGGNGRGTQVSEVWLIKVANGK
ncbi:MAG: glycoside hydrolase family 20 zincin-like fold domain-containing protein [Bryobacteraceae bacterium]